MENYIDIIKIVIYFIVYSFFGWVMESIIKTVIQKKPVNSGFLYGPFCPIYGFGAIIMFLFLESFKDKPVLLFVIGFTILSSWEYLVGWSLEKIFKTKYWDYSENKFNIKGRVCLLNSIFWGILGLVFINYIHPIVAQKLALMPQNMIIYITIILSISIIIDLITSIIKVNNIQSMLERLKEISRTIKEKLEEIKEIKDNTPINMESIQELIEELKYKQTKIKRRLLRQTNRLKKAFPTMKSDVLERINDFLSQKIENIKRDKNK